MPALQRLSEGWNEKSEDGGNARMNILCDARRSTRSFYSTCGPRGRSIHQGHQVYTVGKSTSTSKSCSPGLMLEEVVTYFGSLIEMEM